MFYTAYERCSEAAYDRQLDSCDDGQPLRRTYTPQVPVIVPRPCSKLRTCGLRDNHLGPCDHAYPLVLLPTSAPIFNPTKPTKDIIMKLESSGQFFKFDTIGQVLHGRFVSYTIDKPGNFGPKDELVLRTKTGLVIHDCSAALKRILREHEDKLPGKILKITFTEEKDIGKGNPMKVFDVELDDAPPPKGQQLTAAKPAQHRTVQAPQGRPQAPIMQPADDFDANSTGDDDQIPF
jgi:hypothetical protein